MHASIVLLSDICRSEGHEVFSSEFIITIFIYY